jgi:hypothetical protein
MVTTAAASGSWLGVGQCQLRLLSRYRSVDHLCEGGLGRGRRQGCEAMGPPLDTA